MKLPILTSSVKLKFYFVKWTGVLKTGKYDHFHTTIWPFDLATSSCIKMYITLSRHLIIAFLKSLSQINACKTWSVAKNRIFWIHMPYTHAIKLSFKHTQMEQSNNKYLFCLNLMDIDVEVTVTIITSGVCIY